jgi:ATP/maltotriose-dependent transcriptional regulator MalT
VTDGLAPYLDDARAGRVPADPLVCAHLSARLSIAGAPASVVRPVAEGAFARSPLVDEAAHGVVLAFPVVALMYVDELDVAARALAAALATERAGRSLITLTVAQHWSAVVAHRRGDLLGAGAHAERARTACRTQDWPLYIPWMAANRAMIALDRGDLATARAALGHPRDDEGADPIGRSLKLEARGRLAEAGGNSAEAERWFLAAGALLDRLGLVSPGFMCWRSSAALAGARVGRRDKAAELAAAELELARRVGGRRTIGIALRACALLGPPDCAVGVLSESAALLECSGAPLEHARTLAALGAALRRAGERTAAREPLRAALDTATRAGADPLARQVRDELLAAGGRPRRSHVTGVGALTPMERRMGQLAARGRSNSQIAHELYVTTKTVEWHLANVFRKLGVASRQELPALDGDGERVSST